MAFFILLPTNRMYEENDVKKKHIRVHMNDHVHQFGKIKLLTMKK